VCVAVLQGVFEQPTDADTASIPLMPKDIVVMASDGLFDNLEISEIIAIISAWEQEEEQEAGDISTSSSNSRVNDTSCAARETNSSYDERCQALARSLVLAAREASLDKDKDSPFALLAKENDIMWGGGMPDDTTVVILQLSE
jgi:protein phosphatase PTC7